VNPPDPKASPDADLLSPFPWRASRRTLERLVLAAMLIGLIALKFAYAAHERIYGPDASYYYDIAAHVRDGHGLVTDISLFNAGYERFPHPTAVYPVWPLVLGLSARVVPLDVAAVWLPTFFYLAAVVLAYRLARRVAPDPLFPETWAVLHAGHVAAALVALTTTMFTHTSKPFTEGLAYFLLLLALTRAERFFREPRIWRGLELGAWLGLVVLTRSQLVLGAMAVGGALAWAVLRLGWRRWLGPALAFALGVTAVLAVQVAHLASFVDPPRLVYLLRFDLVHHSELAPLDVMVRTDGALAWLADRARGVPVALGSGKMSYFSCFGLWSAAFLAAAPFLLLDGWRAVQRRSLGLWSWLHAPENLFKLAYALLAILGVVTLQTIHKAMFTPWNFGTRHGLTAGFAILAALLYLCRRPVLGRVVAVFLVAASAYFGFWKISTNIDPSQASARDEWTLAHNAPLVDWLHARAAAEPGLVVVAPDIEIQKLARFTDGVGYHWYYRTTTYQELDYLFRQRGATYLLLRDDQAHKLRVARHPARFARRFVREAGDLSGFSVYRRRRAGEPLGRLPAPPPTAPALAANSEGD
jgi:hypothetical protein